MAFFPDVQRGEPFKPSSALSNEVRHMVNAMNGFKSGCGKNFFPGSNRIQVYNASASTISAGTAVAFSTDALCGDAIPCVPMTTSVPVWGVLSKSLAAREMGDCIITGFARVVISGGSGELAKPDTSNPAQFLRCESGGVPILYSTQDMAIVNVGFAVDGGGGGSAQEYNGMFKIVKNSSIVSVINGASPTSQYAGSTDIGKVPVASFNIPPAGISLYVFASYSGKYVLEIRTSVSTSDPAQYIGSITSSGEIVQAWQQGAINFKYGWYI